MDLNEDGYQDILSGSYSRFTDDEEMAGLFQVLWGNAAGELKPPTPLTSNDGKELVIAEQSGGSVDDAICTRPTAADLDGDGKLDLIVGGRLGRFFFFKGDGKGKFSSTAEPIMAGGRALKVSNKSDPCLVDWDSDGDLDILSGSGFGGVYLAINQGTATSPSFQQPVALIAEKPFDKNSGKPILGDQHIKGPSSSTRVWAEDLNNDGLLDLVVGDTAKFILPIDDKKDTIKRLIQWKKKFSDVESEMKRKQKPLMLQLDQLDNKRDEESSKKRKLLYQKLDELFEPADNMYQQRLEIVRDVSTGYVWVFYQKPSDRNESLPQPQQVTDQ